MDKKCFKLRVKVGSVIVSAKGDYTVTEIPDNALEKIERGCIWLGLTEDALPKLKALPEYRLNKIYELRKAQGFDDDSDLLLQALSSDETTSEEKKETKKKK